MSVEAVSPGKRESRGFVRRILRALGVVVVLAGLVVGSLVVSAYRNPPLRFGFAPVAREREAGEWTTVAWQLINEGRFAVRIREVRFDLYPDQRAIPVWVMGGISTHGRLVASNLSDNPTDDGIILVPIGDFVIPPKHKGRMEVTPEFRTWGPPDNYGLIARYSFRESGRSPMGRITIRYTYMGLPLTLQDEFRDDD